MWGLLGRNKQETATSVSILSGLGFVCENMEGEDEKNSTSKTYQEKIIRWQVRNMSWWQLFFGFSKVQFWSIMCP